MDSVQHLRDLLAIQGAYGNWNHSPYMLGLYNGLELAVATLEDREAVYRDVPAHWAEDDGTEPRPSGFLVRMERVDG